MLYDWFLASFPKVLTLSNVFQIIKNVFLFFFFLQIISKKKKSSAKSPVKMFGFLPPLALVFSPGLLSVM